jgi:hypothetical protein
MKYGEFRQNDELEDIIKRENIVRFIKCQLIRCKTPQLQKKKNMLYESYMRQDEEKDQK